MLRFERGTNTGPITWRSEKERILSAQSIDRTMATTVDGSSATGSRAIGPGCEGGPSISVFHEVVDEEEESVGDLEELNMEERGNASIASLKGNASSASLKVNNLGNASISSSKAATVGNASFASLKATHLSPTRKNDFEERGHASMSSFRGNTSVASLRAKLSPTRTNSQPPSAPKPPEGPSPRPSPRLGVAKKFDTSSSGKEQQTAEFQRNPILAKLKAREGSGESNPRTPQSPIPATPKSDISKDRAPIEKASPARNVSILSAPPDRSPLVKRPTISRPAAAPKPAVDDVQQESPVSNSKPTEEENARTPQPRTPGTRAKETPFDIPPPPMSSPKVPKRRETIASPRVTEPGKAEPAWAKPRLKSTQQGASIKSGIDIQNPITHVPREDGTEITTRQRPKNAPPVKTYSWEKPEWATPKLRATRKRDVVKANSEAQASATDASKSEDSDRMDESQKSARSSDTFG